MTKIFDQFYFISRLLMQLILILSCISEVAIEEQYLSISIPMCSHWNMPFIFIHKNMKSC